MNRLIRDLQDLASIDSGRLSMHAQRTDLKALLTEALGELQSMAARKAVRLDVELGGDLPSVSCDGERVLQVLSNLAGNAIKFTPEGGHVSVRAAQRGDELVVTVSDTGPGIAEKDLPHLFERFYRGQNVREPGTGLGLSIAQAIIDLHHGRIGVEATSAAGSRFFFALPVDHPCDQSAAKQ